VAITDNYLLRGYKALQKQLRPDSLFFLGDLFDGGREWKTERGHFTDPRWGRQRPSDEAKFVEEWHNTYGEDFWLHEYGRFGSIFFDHFNDGGTTPGPYQRGRKLVASLPGNHDLGFGAQVQVPVRDRFSAFFGDVNRVDVVGNHTIVSVDTVSLSADTSNYKLTHDLKPIHGPANQFLRDMKKIKRKAVEEELSVWHGNDRELQYDHRVEELDDSDLERFPRSDPGPAAADFPTILLTHVPLYRLPGTPCGPKREHWPPTKPPKGQSEPVNPDNRNAISVTAGYQYQNVLNNEDTIKLVSSVGNVVQVFSGDDHDYCELKHDESRGGVNEITVKSMSMAMGVPTPGFVMVSLYNPVDHTGKPVNGAPEKTLQTHLCLLPNQIQSYLSYVALIVITLVLLAVRAFLVPALGLEPFALSNEVSRAASSSKSDLPMFSSSKDKVEPPELRPSAPGSAVRSHGRTSSVATNGHWQSAKMGRRGWVGPRITIDEGFPSSRKKWRPTWRSNRPGKQDLGVVGRELWTSTWRVAWMAVLFFVYLSRER
jgi:hypothetical protein